MIYMNWGAGDSTCAVVIGLDNEAKEWASTNATR